MTALLDMAGEAQGTAAVVEPQHEFIVALVMYGVASRATDDLLLDAVDEHGFELAHPRRPGGRILETVRADGVDGRGADRMVIAQVGSDQLAAVDELNAGSAAETVQSDGPVMASHAQDAVHIQGVVAERRVDGIEEGVELAFRRQRVVPQGTGCEAVDFDLIHIVGGVAGQADLSPRPACVREVVGTSGDLGIRASGSASEHSNSREVQ